MGTAGAENKACGIKKKNASVTQLYLIEDGKGYLQF